MQPLELILANFEQVSSVPRGTKHEARIRQWLIDWATARSLKSRVDAAGNLVVCVPASAGYESQPTLILQGHLDMVWQKTPDSDHDFMRDPIRLIRNGDWITADRTTLGADNGIAVALMMALVEDAAVSHPALELLFTVEEEVGIGGADLLDPALVTGRTMVNLDSEEEGTFTVGCAGGGSVMIHLPVTWQDLIAEMVFLRLKIGGLLGGHSGGDIQKHRGNANKLLARALDEIQRSNPIQLVAFKGGSARNAIPRDAEAILACRKDQVEDCHKSVSAFEKTLQAEFAATEKGLFLSVERLDQKNEKTTSLADTVRMIQLMMSLPNGVDEMSAEIEGFVETSNNIGIVELLEDGFHVVSNHRSSVASRLEAISRRVESLARLAGAQTERTQYFPPWQPNRGSALLKKTVSLYEKLFGQEARVELSHGGLECGIISDRCGGMDAISCGPTIEAPHSPDERLYVPSLPKVWDFLVALLAMR